MMKEQLSRDLFKGQRGGRRPGSGRRRIHSKGVAHRTREEVKKRYPLHINFKYKIHIKNKESLKLLKRAILNARSHGLRIIHYSLQSNHVHLIVESSDNSVLTKGMRSLTVTMAKGLKKGKVQIERYHLHLLKNLKESQNAVRYVLLNEQKHLRVKKLRVDGYSSLRFMGIEFVRSLVKREKLSMVWEEIKELPFLDPPTSWILNNC